MVDCYHFGDEVRGHADDGDEADGLQGADDGKGCAEGAKLWSCHFGRWCRKCREWFGGIALRLDGCEILASSVNVLRPWNLDGRRWYRVLNSVRRRDEFSIRLVENVVDDNWAFIRNESRSKNSDGVGPVGLLECWISKLSESGWLAASVKCRMTMYRVTKYQKRQSQREDKNEIAERQREETGL